MNHVWRLGVFLGIAAVFLSGCMVPRVVVDPTYGKAKYEDLVRKGDPFKWKVAVEMQWNGVHQPRHDMTLRHHVERVLRNSGLILPTPDSTAGEIKVVLNDTADVEAARAKGLATAFSFGIVGNTVTDYLEMDIAISANGKTIKKTGLKHACHSTVGDAKIPEDLEVLSPSESFGRAVEQMLLNGLKELQESGELSMLQPSAGNGSRRSVHG